MEMVRKPVQRKRKLLNDFLGFWLMNVKTICQGSTWLLKYNTQIRENQAWLTSGMPRLEE